MSNRQIPRKSVLFGVGKVSMIDDKLRYLPSTTERLLQSLGKGEFQDVHVSAKSISFRDQQEEGRCCKEVRLPKMP